MFERERLTSMFIDQAKQLAETASGRLPFQHKFKTKMSAQTLWYELQKALVRSTTSDIWPNELATIESDGLEPHAILEVKYKFFFTNTACQYKITDMEPGKFIKYHSLKQHIFDGGGEIRIEPNGAGATLEWSGEYQFERPKSVQALVFRLYFQQRFFARLRANLQKPASV